MVIESTIKTRDSIPLCCAYGFDRANEDQIKSVVNGCGTGGWKSRLVPDTMYGLFIGEACDIHDWDYEYGETNEEKERADRAFRNNLLRLVDARTDRGWIGQHIILPMRRRRCQIYFEVVYHFGGPAFWDGKARP